VKSRRKRKRLNPDWSFIGPGVMFCRVHGVVTYGGTCEGCDQPAFKARNRGMKSVGYDGPEPEMIVGLIQPLPEDV
jgi:hypothetical protein